MVGSHAPGSRKLGMQSRCCGEASALQHRRTGLSNLMAKESSLILLRTCKIIHLESLWVDNAAGRCGCVNARGEAQQQNQPSINNYHAIQRELLALGAASPCGPPRVIFPACHDSLVSGLTRRKCSTEREKSRTRGELVALLLHPSNLRGPRWNLGLRSVIVCLSPLAVSLM
jgi:hypothetical protein